MPPTRWRTNASSGSPVGDAPERIRIGRGHLPPGGIDATQPAPGLVKRRHHELAAGLWSRGRLN
jgi:hypothetical protein